jgi:hypothetical protein
VLPERVAERLAQVVHLPHPPHPHREPLELAAPFLGSVTLLLTQLQRLVRRRRLDVFAVAAPR